MTICFGDGTPQRLLVERGQTDVVPQLIELASDKSVDAIGLNVGAIHALWTLHGLGALDGSNPRGKRLRHRGAAAPVSRRAAQRVTSPATRRRLDRRDSGRGVIGRFRSAGPPRGRTCTIRSAGQRRRRVAP